MVRKPTHETENKKANVPASEKQRGSSRAAAGSRPSNRSNAAPMDASDFLKTPQGSGRKPPSSKKSAAHRPSSGTSRNSASPRRSSVGSAKRSSSGRSSSKASAGRRPSSGTRSVSSNRQTARKRQSQNRKKRKTLGIVIAAFAIAAVAAIVIIILSAGVPAPTELTIESSSTSQILSWKGKPKNISYEVYKKTPDSDFQLIHTVPEEAPSTYVSQDLQSATLYSYKVIAVKGQGEKARKSEEQEISAYTLPETLTGCKAQTMSKESLTCTWPNIQTPDGYELKYGQTEALTDAAVLTLSPSDVTTSPDGTTCSYTIGNLTEGTTYFMSIRSFCGEDVFSEWSQVFSSVVTRAVDMTGVDINRPMVALTYDDGPDKGSVSTRIMEAVESAGGHATFFQLGNLAEIYPEVIQRMVSGGHEVACHTYNHEHMGKAVNADDIINGNNAIEAAGGVRPSSFRSPGGQTTDAIRSTCESQGQALYFWSVDTRDWQSRDADSVVNEIMSNTSDGDIILMHNLYDSTADATERIVPWLVEQGYQLVTVSQLVQAKTGQPPVPGKQYYTGDRCD